MRKCVKMVCVGMLLLSALLLTDCLGRVGGQGGCAFARQRLKVATTTSLYDTGLWEYLEPAFEEKFNVKLDIIYAGTGIALEYGKRGDVDVIAIHDRQREDAFVEQGYGVNRRCFAYNYFILVGPEIDPAGIRNMLPEEAFQKLMMEGQTNPDKIRFVSRGDGSGTHAREKTVWSKAGYAYSDVQKSGSWYVEAGRGMGPTLLMASEMEAYTLTDIGTFLAFVGDLELVSLVAEGEVLLNVYAILAIDPEKHARVDIRMANNLINFLISDEVQELIANYGVEEYGVPLFYPGGGGQCKDIGCPAWEECATRVK
ncbi:substrate-binding domain-containing protein [Candidatus Aerophobetes bacterium]|nr:substrate-binding domain-containing protein [Candidatus Aerophobetes bacterium]